MKQIKDSIYKAKITLVNPGLEERLGLDTKTESYVLIDVSKIIALHSGLDEYEEDNNVTVIYYESELNFELLENTEEVIEAWLTHKNK